MHFCFVVEKVPSLGSFVVAAVSSWRESGTADQSQSHPGEGTTQEPPEPWAMVRKHSVIDTSGGQTQPGGQAENCEVNEQCQCHQSQ